jgi:hypothetical protein
MVQLEKAKIEGRAVGVAIRGAFTEPLAFGDVAAGVYDFGEADFSQADPPRSGGKAKVTFHRTDVARLVGLVLEGLPGQTGAGLHMEDCNDCTVVEPQFEDLGWCAINSHRTVNLHILRPVGVRCNSTGNVGHDAGGLGKHTRATGLRIIDPTTEDMRGTHHWLDHNVIDAQIIRPVTYTSDDFPESDLAYAITVEKADGVLIEDWVHAGPSYGVFTIRASRNVTLRQTGGQLLENTTWRQITLGGATVEDVDGEPFQSEYCTFEGVRFKGVPNTTPKAPFNTGYGPGPISPEEAWNQFAETSTWDGEPISEGVEPPPIDPDPPIEPPEPPDTECGCEEALALVLIELDAIQATLDRIEVKQDRPLIPLTE